MKEVTILKGFIRNDVNVGFCCPYNGGLCSENCAWFDIQTRTIYQTAIGYETPIRDIRVITCKGTPIAKLVEESND